MGNNAFGVCGVGHNYEVENVTEIPELSGMGVKQFRHGDSFVLALTSDHKIYSWGSNDCGKLARGQPSNIYQTPDRIELDYNFVDISCFNGHAIALTSDGRVYAWGDNSFGQNSIDLSTKNYEINYLSTLPKIQWIYCSYNESYAITNEGDICFWRQIVNRKNEKLENILELIDYTVFEDLDCVTISSSIHNNYFLSEDGQLYFNGRHMTKNGTVLHSTIPLPINFKGTIKSMLPNLDLNNFESKCCVLVETTEGTKVHYLEDNQIFRTDYNNLIDYFAEKSQTTPNTILSKTSLVRWSLPDNKVEQDITNSKPYDIPSDTEREKPIIYFTEYGIDDTIRSKIILFHVFNDQSNRKNYLLVTSDDEVYAMGNNCEGVLWFGSQQGSGKCN